MHSQQQLSSQDQQQLKKMKQSLIQKRRQTRKKLLEGEYPFQFVIDARMGITGYLSLSEFEKKRKQSYSYESYKNKNSMYGEIDETFKRITQMPKRTDHYHIIQNKVSDLQKQNSHINIEGWTFHFQFRAGCKTLTQVLEWDHLFYPYIASKIVYKQSIGKDPITSNYLYLSLKQKCQEMKQKQCTYMITYKDQVLGNHLDSRYTQDIYKQYIGDSLLISRYLDIVHQQSMLESGRSMSIKPLRVNQRGDFIR